MKRYHIGKVFKKTPKSFEQRRNAIESLEASFDILSLPLSPGTKHNNGDEFIYEAEVLKVCDQVASIYSKEILRGYRIRVSSTEILDLILDEAWVPLQNRLQVLQLLSTLETKAWLEVKKELTLKNLVDPQYLSKMQELIQIRGNLEQIEAQTRTFRKRQGKEDRFQKILERFKSIRNYLKYFGVYEEDPSGQTGSIVFDFGLVLENQLSYYAGLIFKLVANIATSTFQDTPVSQSDETIGIRGRVNSKGMSSGHAPPT